MTEQDNHWLVTFHSKLSGPITPDNYKLSQDLDIKVIMVIDIFYGDSKTPEQLYNIPGFNLQ